MVLISVLEIPSPASHGTTKKFALMRTENSTRNHMTFYNKLFFDCN